MADQGITTITWDVGGLTPNTTYTCLADGCRDVTGAVDARMIERHDWGLLSLTESDRQWAEGQQYTCQAVMAETQGGIMSGFLEAVGFVSLAIVAVLVMIAIAQAIANTFTVLDKHEQLRATLNDQIGDLSAKIGHLTKAKKGTKP